MTKSEEIGTIRPRTININLSDADVKRLCKKAGYSGLTVSELLQNFIGDLVDGTYSNGSDERMYANRWFDRCWFAMDTIYDDTFLKYLIEMGMVETVIDAWSEIKRYEKLEDLDEDDSACYEDEKEFLDETFSEYIEDRITGQEPPKLEAEMETVMKWWNEYQQLTSRPRRHRTAKRAGKAGYSGTV